MDIFNINLPPEENDKDKFPKLDSWFDFMNDQFKKIEESHEKSKTYNNQESQRPV
ncbi:MAG: hypothetical protein ACUZ8H_01515 [Candidatus Anammoxibacter sp.]